MGNVGRDKANILEKGKGTRMKKEEEQINIFTLLVNPSYMNDTVCFVRKI